MSGLGLAGVRGVRFNFVKRLVDFAAIKDNREPNSSVQQVLPCYKVLHDLEQHLNAAA